MCLLTTGLSMHITQIETDTQIFFLLNLKEMMFYNAEYSSNYTETAIF